MRIDAGSSTEDNGFTGYEKDQATNLNYAEARYYNSETGRFISQDPAVLRIGQNQREMTQLLNDPQQLNTYSYVRNNPIKYNDPTGEIIPLLVGAWAVAEVALTVYDTYNAVKTVSSSSASGLDKGLAVGGVVAGALLPGGGYGKGTQVTQKVLKDQMSQVDNVAQSRSILVDTTQNAELKKPLDALYRPGAQYADGGTAMALKKEAITGVPVGNRGFHFTKATERITNINNVMRTQSLSSGDYQRARYVVDQLQSALDKVNISKFKDRIKN